MTTMSSRRYSLMRSASHESGHHVANWCRYRIDGYSIVAKYSSDRETLNPTRAFYKAIDIGPVACLAGVVAEMVLDPFGKSVNAVDIATNIQWFESECENATWLKATKKQFFRNRRQQKAFYSRPAKPLLALPSFSDLTLITTDFTERVEILQTAIDLLTVHMPQLLFVRDRLLAKGSVSLGELPQWERDNGLALSPLWLAEAGPAPWHRDEIKAGRIIEPVIESLNPQSTLPSPLGANQ